MSSTDEYPNPFKGSICLGRSDNCPFVYTLTVCNQLQPFSWFCFSGPSQFSKFLARGLPAFHFGPILMYKNKLMPGILIFASYYFLWENQFMTNHKSISKMTIIT